MDVMSLTFKVTLWIDLNSFKSFCLLILKSPYKLSKESGQNCVVMYIYMYIYLIKYGTALILTYSFAFSFAHLGVSEVLLLQHVQTIACRDLLGWLILALIHSS